MSRQFKVGDIVDACDQFNECKASKVKRIDEPFYWVCGLPFYENELTLIRAVDEPSKTYNGQFEVGNAPSFNKMLDSLPL